MTTTTLDKFSQYGNDYQVKLFASILSDSMFFRRIITIIEAEYFESDSFITLIRIIKKHFEKFNNVPSLETIGVYISKMNSDSKKVFILSELNAIRLQTDSIDLPFIKEESIEFCKNKKIKSAIEESINLLQYGKYDEIRKVVNDAMSVGNDLELGSDLKSNIMDRYKDEERHPISTPWELITDLTSGGLGAGDLGIIVMSTGGGKCVGPDTVISIQYKGDSDIITKDVKIKDLFDFNNVPNEENASVVPNYDIKVKTPYGYYNIESMFRTEKQKSITVYFKNGSTLKCSNHHRLMTGDGWKEINELNDMNRIFTDGGTTSLLRIVEHDEEILYDISVNTVHCYYSNSILSHNSWSLAAIGAHAAKQGKKVLHITLELLESYTLQRYDSVITGIHFTDLKYNLESVESQVSSIKGNINVKYYPSKRATINTIQSYVESLRGEGFNPDMIILDYADKLKYTINAKSNDASDLGNLYDEVKGLAGELKVPIWTASQTGRCHSICDVVSTKNGDIEIGNIKIGDYIDTHKGFKMVTNVFPMTTQDVYRITLKNGKKITVSANHNVPVVGCNVKSINTGLRIGDVLFCKK